MFTLKPSKNILLLIIAIALHSLAFTQSGPAGVGSSANNVVWLDAHALGFSNGVSVSTAADFSGNGNTFSEVSSTKQPIYSTTAANGMPALVFDGANDILKSGSIAAIASANVTYFIVFQKSLMTKQSLLAGNYTSNPSKWLTQTFPNSNKLYTHQYSPTAKHVNYLESTASPTFMSSSISPTQIKTYSQGNLQMTNNTPYTTPSGHKNLTIGNVSFPSANNHTLNGFIAEVIIYNSSLNNLQRILIENYLGAKYNMAIPTDLYAWDATHRIELVAIGNNGTNSQATAKGKGVMQFSAPTGMTANEFLLAAHTDFAFTDYNTTNLPASLPLHQRLERTWRASETGDVGSLTVTFELAGVNDFADATSYRLLVDTDGDFTNATIVSGTYSAGSVSFNVNLAHGDFFTLAGIEDIQEIHSFNGGGNWSDINTWDCACIPAANDNVTIDPGHPVVVDIDGFANNFSIDDDLSFSGPNTLSILGEIDMTGTLTMTDGTISLDGSTQQYFDAGGANCTFHNLTINNSSGLPVDFFSSDYVLNGKLSMLQGTLAIENAGGGTFTVNSTSATTNGRVGQIISPASITGIVKVKRFISAGNADWRNLASPVVGASFSQWDPDLAMSGINFPDGCAYGPSGCFHSVKFTDKSISYDVSNVSDPITNTRGFEIFCGTDLTTFAGTTLTTTGNLNSSADIPLSLQTGWSTVGNPYACPINYNGITKTSQISNYYYVYDAAAGAYQWYDASGAGSSSVPEITNNGLVASGQGIWVFATSLGTMTFKQSDKSDVDATFIRSNSNQPNELFLTISEDASTYNSIASIEESILAADGFDSLIDIMHLAPGTEKAPSLAFFFEENLVRKNYILNDLRDKSFKMHLDVKNEGYHTITASNIDVFAHYQKVLIYDNLTGEFFDLKAFPEYKFFAEAGKSQRFELILSNSANGEIAGFTATSNIEDELSITQMGNYLNIINGSSQLNNVELSLVNIIGQQQVFFDITSLNEGGNLVALPTDLNGVYLFTIKTTNKTVTKKLVF